MKKMQKEKKKQAYYDITQLDHEGANINIAIGERSNGKSYQVKLVEGVNPYFHGKERCYTNTITKKIYKDYIASNSRFILLRRWKSDITTSYVEQYFKDINFNAISGGEYQGVIAWRDKIYLAKYNEDENKLVKTDEYIGYYGALSTEQHYAGASYLDVNTIIYEEFMSRDSYLKDEPNKLMNFYSTVDRKRGTTKLYMVGNSITKINPFLKDWGLDKVINKMKQGDICSYFINAGESDGESEYIKISVEYCASSGKSSYIIGSHANMLNSGEWQSDPQPHLPKSKKCYNIELRIVFFYKRYKFLGELLSDKIDGSICWFIYPYNGKINNNTLVFSDVIKTSQYWQKDIYNPTLLNSNVREALATFKENMIFYATDMCGTDFKQAIDFSIRK